MSDATAIAVNPYSAPNSELQQSVGNTDVIADPRLAIERGYDFSIGELLSEAWQKTSGVKGILWGGFAAIAVVSAAIQLVIQLVGVGIIGVSALGGGASMVFGIIAVALLSVFLSVVVIYPFLAGSNMIGIRQAAGQPVEFSEMFKHFGRTLPLFGLGLLIFILSSIGYLLLFIPGLYISVASILAIPLVVERKLSAWNALLVSCKAINKHWFKVFFLLLSMSLILFVSALPLGIGLIWTLPMFIVMIGVLYNRIFGVLPPAA